MVSKDDPDRNYKYNFLGSSPRTEKAYRTQMSVSQDGSLFAYCVGKSVIVKKQENDLKGDIVVYNRHKSNTTCVDIAPKKIFVASGDEDGNVHIFFSDDGTPKFSQQVIPTKVVGIHWNEKSDRLLVYGNFSNKPFCRYVTWDSFNNVGEISGSSKSALCGDLKKTKPFAGIVASEDLVIRMYEGNLNLKPKYSIKDNNRYICEMKFSPKEDKFAAVGLGKYIHIYETETGNLLEKIEKEYEGQHTNCILGVCWLNNDTLATSSMDKTVKIWDLPNKKHVTLTIDSKSKNVDSDMQHGLIIAKEYLVSLSLNGAFNLFSLNKFFETNQIESFSTVPDKIYHGHQGHISFTRFNKREKRLYSGDVSGKISKKIIYFIFINLKNSCLGKQ